LITKACYVKFHELYYGYLERENLIPEDTDDYGYLTRIMSDIIRIGIYNYMKKNKNTEKFVTISEPSCFIESFGDIHTLIQQFTNPRTKGKYDQYRALLKEYPGRKKEFYYQKLGITRETLYQYDKKIGKADDDYIDGLPKEEHT
jgi:hypothetical protein